MGAEIVSCKEVGTSASGDSIIDIHYRVSGHKNSGGNLNSSSTETKFLYAYLYAEGTKIGGKRDDYEIDDTIRYTCKTKGAEISIQLKVQWQTRKTEAYYIKGDMWDSAHSELYGYSKDAASSWDQMSYTNSNARTTAIHKGDSPYYPKSKGDFTKPSNTYNNNDPNRKGDDTWYFRTEQTQNYIVSESILFKGEPLTVYLYYKTYTMEKYFSVEKYKWKDWEPGGSENIFKNFYTRPEKTFNFLYSPNAWDITFYGVKTYITNWDDFNIYYGKKLSHKNQGNYYKEKILAEDGWLTLQTLNTVYIALGKAPISEAYFEKKTFNDLALALSNWN